MTVDYKYPNVDKCRATVWERDTYRYTGRGKSGFEMHFIKRQCKRKPNINGYCWQHEREYVSGIAPDEKKEGIISENK